MPHAERIYRTHNLNRLLQEKFSSRGLYVQYGGTTYYVGDKVMQIKNNYDKNVFNGDIGFIEDINRRTRSSALSLIAGLWNTTY